MSQQSHSVISPAILYWGTPVVLITTENDDSTNNIAPMSSAWWLGYSCMLGLDGSSKTTENILRTKQCVLNLVDHTMVAYVNALSNTTGSDPVPPSKQSRNYHFVKDKWTRAGLTPQESDLVRPPRIAECPVQMECEMIHHHGLCKDLTDMNGLLSAIEVRVLRVHVFDDLRMEGYLNRIDPDKWRPLIMSFQELYSLTPSKVGVSVLGRINEELYRGITGNDVTELPGDDDAELATQGATVN